MCIGSLKRGFTEGCRKVISIDACFIKGPWNGKILVVVARDANNQMYPLARGLVAVENWMWFCNLLQDDLDMGNGEG